MFSVVAGAAVCAVVVVVASVVGAVVIECAVRMLGGGRRGESAGYKPSSSKSCRLCVSMISGARAHTCAVRASAKLVCQGESGHAVMLALA